MRRWLETTGRLLQHVSVITLAEIQKGIELLAGTHLPRKRHPGEADDTFVVDVPLAVAAEGAAGVGERF